MRVFICPSTSAEMSLGYQACSGGADSYVHVAIMRCARKTASDRAICPVLRPFIHRKHCFIGHCFNVTQLEAHRGKL